MDDYNEYLNEFNMKDLNLSSLFCATVYEDGKFVNYNIAKECDHYTLLKNGSEDIACFLSYDGALNYYKAEFAPI